MLLEEAYLKNPAQDQEAQSTKGDSGRCEVLDKRAY